MQLSLIEGKDTVEDKLQGLINITTDTETRTKAQKDLTWLRAYTFKRGPRGVVVPRRGPSGARDSVVAQGAPGNQGHRGKVFYYENPKGGVSTAPASREEVRRYRKYRGDLRRGRVGRS